MHFNSQNLEMVGRFFDTSKVPVTDRVILYVIGDTHYRIDEDGCWYFADDPYKVGWTKCDPPVELQEMM